MFLVIITDKAITRFQNSLERSLLRSGFNADDSAIVLQKATEQFKSIARANPLKPKSIPDDGLNVAGAIASLRKSLRGAKEIIMANPALLFEYHGLTVPECVEQIQMVSTEDNSSRKRKPRTPHVVARKNKEKIDITEIIKAAKNVFEKSGLRPDMGIGVIPDGSLAGKKWATLNNQIGNNPDFMLREGFTSISKIFDVAMVGARHKPCDSQKARYAFCEAFEMAAKRLGPQNYTRSLVFSHAKETKRDLPYVFTMVEESILETTSRTGATVFSLNTIDHGPLAGMKLTAETLNNLFHGAKNENPDFPFYGLSDFIADRKLSEKASQRMVERAMAPK